MSIETERSQAAAGGSNRPNTTMHSKDTCSSSSSGKNMKPLRQQLHNDLLAGFVTSTVYTTATYPVHRVKILIQTQDSHPSIISGKVPRYSFLHAFGRIVREQGLTSLWRGNTPYLLRHIPSITTSFAFKDAFREVLPKYDPRTDFPRFLAANIASGALAGALSLAIVYPFEFATIHMAADIGVIKHDPGQPGRSFPQRLRAMAQQRGVLSWYEGFSIGLFSMMAYKALYFGLYDSAKGWLYGDAPDMGNIWIRWLLASGSVFTAASVTYPLDIIRKRLIVDVGRMDRQYSGVADCVRKIALQEGLRGFYRFYSYDMIFRLGGGLLLVMYDEIKLAHGRANPSKLSEGLAEPT